MINDKYICELNKNFLNYFAHYRNDDLTPIKPIIEELLIYIMDQYRKHLQAFKRSMKKNDTPYANELIKITENVLQNMAKVKTIFKEIMQKTTTLSKEDYLSFVQAYGFANIILDNILYETLVALIKKEFHDKEWEKLMFGTKTIQPYPFLYYLNGGQINTGILLIDIDPLVEIVESNMSMRRDRRDITLDSKIKLLKSFQMIIEDYIDEDSKSQNRMYQSEIGELIKRIEYYEQYELSGEYGIDPGTFREMSYYLNTCGELELFMIINDKAGEIQFLKDDFRDAGGPYLDIKREYLALDYAAMQTQRFGVEMSLPTDNQRVNKKEQFSDWYEWWWHYVYKVLNNDERKKTKELIKIGGDISDYRPEGTWKQATKVKHMNE